MTDEEMAHVYAYNHIHYELAKREDGTEYAKEVSSVTIKEAFLAGLEAGRPKWHKVADGDLPRIEIGCCSIDVLTDSGRLAYYHYDDNCWVDSNDVDVIETPKEWCEILRFKRKTNGNTED